MDKTSRGGKKIGKAIKLGDIKTLGKSLNHNETVLRG